MLALSEFTTMPTFDDVEESLAPVEEEAALRPRTVPRVGYPDFPMPQLLDTVRDEHRVVVSCLVSDLRFQWRLEPLAATGTRISVHVEIPQAEAHRFDAQRDVISRSIRRLAKLAADASVG
jgi:hypothetical protein